MSRIPTTAEKVLLRAQTFRSKTFMVVEKGTNLFTAYVNDAAIEEGDVVITYDNDMGEDNVLAGMTLFNKALDDIGNEKGSARIKSIDTAANEIAIEPNSIEWENNEELLVDGVFRLYRILPSVVAGVVYEDDDEAYSDQNDYDKKKPVALMGSSRWAWTGEAKDFYGWRSYAKAVDANGNRYSIASWAWDFDGGTIVSGAADEAGTPSSPNWVKWNTPGEYHVSLLVTDENGNTHRAYRVVIVVDRPGQGDSPPYEDFEVTLLEGSWESGDWRASIKVYGDADPSEFPNNAQTILFSEDWYGDTKQSIGGWYGQEDIELCAFVIEDSVRQDSETGDVTFEVASTVNQLKELDMWPLNFKNVDAAPTAWHEFEDMTVEDVFWHIVEKHTTLKNIADVFIWSGESGGKRIDFIDITEASIYDQLDQQLLSSIYGHLVASRYSSVHGNKNFNMLNLSQRLEVGHVMMILEKQDRLDDLEIAGERHRDAVCQVDFVGFVYDENGDPLEVFSLAPENQKNFGRVEKERGILLTGSSVAEAQDEADELAGLYLAHQNIRFPNVTVNLGNYRLFDPANQDLVGLRVEEDDTLRGFDWWDSETERAKEFIVRRVTYELNHEAGYMVAILGLEASTWGKDGVAGEYPPIEPPDEPEEPPPYYPPEPEPTLEGTHRLVGTRAKGFYRTENFTGPGGGDPTWVKTWPSGAGIDDGLSSIAIWQLIYDPWNRNRQFCIAGALGSGIVYRRNSDVSDLWVPVLTTDEVRTLTGSSLGEITWIGGNMNKAGHFYVLYNSDLTNNGIWCIRTTDYGDTWAAHQIYSGNYNYEAGNIVAGALQGTSDYPAGDVIYAACNTKLGAGVTIYASFDDGITWSERFHIGSSTFMPRCMRDPSDQSIVYFGTHVDLAKPKELYRSTEHGANAVEVDDIYQLGIFVQLTIHSNMWINIYDNGFMRVATNDRVWKRATFDGTWSNPGGQTGKGIDAVFTTYSHPNDLTLVKYESGTIIAPYQPHVIFVTNDEGATVEGRSGAHCDEEDGGGDSIPYDCGGVAFGGVIRLEGD